MTPNHLLCRGLGFAVAILSASFTLPALADNPIEPGKGLTDPHVVIYGDRAFMYATHDFSPTTKGFVMKDWWVWSSADLVNWKQEGILKPEETYLKKPFDDCWATFGATKNGKYYWYFSAGTDNIGVVVADSPSGPWKDPLGKPMIAKGLTKTAQRDPDILMDDDGKAYIVYGTFHYFIALLSDDMISLAEAPRPVSFDKLFGPYGEGKTDDKPSLHKRNGVYYLSYSSFYATSPNVYGPYTFKGSVIAKENVAPEFQVPTKGPVGLWHDRHGNFFTWHNQWFYACNDKSQPGRSSHYRDSILSYVHYLDNGDIAPVRIDKTGVGQYDGTKKIEAEDFFAAEQGEVKQCAAGGFEVRGLKDGSSLTYPKVRDLGKNTTLSLRVAGSAQGSVEVRKGAKDGQLLGTCAVKAGEYQDASCTLNNEAGTLDVCLVIKGGPFQLDALSFGKR